MPKIMIIFLYGQDTYRSRQKLKEIVEHYKKIHKSGLNLKYFDGKDLNFSDFLEKMRQSSMFKEKKLAILKDAFSNSEFKENFLKEGKKFVESGNIFLFYETRQISEGDPLFLFFKKYSRSQGFESLGGQKLRNWVKKEFEKYGKNRRIEEGALEKLIEFVGNDLWQMANEIKKLSSYKKEENSVNLSDIKLLIEPKVETDIFKTIDAIALKDKRRALQLLKAHLRKGDSPQYLFSMINFQFRNLLMAKSNQMSYEKLRLHPYLLRKTIQLARKFSLEELKKIYRKIFQIDLAMKTGKIEPEMALDLLITEL